MLLQEKVHSEHELPDRFQLYENHQVEIQFYQPYFSLYFYIHNTKFSHSLFDLNRRFILKEILDIYKVYKVSEKVKMSSSLKFCILAAGEADIYAANARAYEWDIAAGHTILEHAGGYMTTHEEKEFLYGEENYKNLPIIAKRSVNLEK